MPQLNETLTHRSVPEPIGGEYGVNHALWDVFDRVDTEIADAVIRALASMLPSRTRALLEDFVDDSTQRHLYGYMKGGFRPDLMLFDDDDQIRVVIEIKCGAPGNSTSLQHSRIGGRFAGEAGSQFNDQTARQILEAGGIDGGSNIDRHDPTSCTLPCIGHSKKDRTGRVLAGLAQIDAYRVSRRWIPDDVKLDDADRVAWVFLDSQGRSAAQAFSYSAVYEETWALSGEVWDSVGFSGLADAIDAEMSLLAPGVGRAKIDRLVYALRSRAVD
ncbi:hypothetical protein [Microterricola viridarii]|uniref:hypothetical protein n=1 Tax=Microterricola viridarii TaxID=412690 RepID=UPI00101AD3F7|nr:hypothetical protein [Microterricola viridarii]